MANYQFSTSSSVTGDQVFIAENVVAVVNVCPVIETAAEKFALARIGLSEALYRSRGEAQTSKMINDIVTGVIAEQAVYSYLVSKGYNCTPPDLSIHEAGAKTYNADLSFSLADSNQYIHVKSQSKASADKYGESWLFQGEDRALSLPSETGYAFLCIVDHLTVTIKAAVYLIDILEADIVSRPKVFKYGFSKKAIYMTDLLKSGINLQRF